MQLPVAIGFLLVGFLQTAVAFNFKTDSCIPTIDTFDSIPVSQRIRCSQQFKYVHGINEIKCDHASLQFYVVRNQLQVNLKSSNQDQSFTVHGACLKKGRQIAHLDLHVAALANQKYEHLFSGLNRECPGDELVFYSYVMNDAQLQACAANPISPF